MSRKDPGALSGVGGGICEAVPVVAERRGGSPRGVRRGHVGAVEGNR